MKKFFLLFALPLFFISCDKSETLKVNGTVTKGDLNGQKIYFYSLELDSLLSKGPILRDSSEIVNGKFAMKLSFDENPSLGLIGLGSDETKNDLVSFADVFIILEPGTLDMTLDGQRVTIKGTPKNDTLNNDFYSLVNQTIDMRDEASKAGGVEAVPLDENGKDIITRMKDKSRELKKNLFGFVKDNIRTHIGEVLFIALGDSFKPDQQMELIAMSDTSFQNREEIKEIKEIIDLKKQKEAAIVGTEYKNLQFLNMNEAIESLSKHIGKGKYVFLDFWATWCRPCLEEMPALMDVYDKYKGKDFEIVSISLDQDKKTWFEALPILNLPWVQLFDINQVAGQEYQISAIPYTLLIDKDGKIIAMELSAEDLDDKLEEILK